MAEKERSNSDRKLTIPLPDDLYASLQMVAAQRRIDRAKGASMSAIAVEAIEAYLKKHR